MKKIIAAFCLSLWIISLFSCKRISPQPTREIEEGSINFKIGRKDTINNIIINSSPKRTLAIQYLGCGGLLINHQGDQVLIDPFFSNQSIGKVGFSAVTKFYRQTERSLEKLKKIKPDTTLINTLLNEKVQLNNVTGVLISHAHYDHLLDYPYIEKNYLLRGKASANGFIKIGSNSVTRLVENITRKDWKKVEDTDSLTTHKKLGEVIFLNDAKTIRIYPIQAEHAPHLASVKVFDGEVCYTIPDYKKYKEGTHSHDWREGMTLAFLMEFISQDTFRVFIQTSASCPPYGFLPKDFTKKIHLAILGIANYDNVCCYPDSIIKTYDPEKILLVHWEDFFRKYNHKKGPKLVRGTDIPAYLKKIEATTRNNKYYMVEPLTNVEVKY